MRRLFLGVVWLVLAALGARAEAPALLDAAHQKLVADEDHWAYTQTTHRVDKDEGETIARYDPSQPEDKQWQLIKYKGRVPTDHEIRTYLKRKEKERKQREQKSLGDLIDVDNAKVHQDAANETVFELPLKKDASNRFPPAKFQMLMTVDKKHEALVHFTLKSREAFRMIGVAKVNAVEVDGTLKTIDERYAPQPSFIKASGNGSILFVKMGAAAEIAWTDFKRVTPYKDRFGVKVGDVKALDF